MKILSLNIRQGGGGDRVKSILKEIELAPDNDVVVLTEFRDNDNRAYFKTVLDYLGYKHQYDTTGEPLQNSVFVASKIPCKFKVFKKLGVHSHRVVQVNMDMTDLKIFACYFPQKNEKKPLFKFLLKVLPKLPKAILCGDINTGKREIDENGKSFYCYKQFEQLETSANLTDAWRAIHGDKKEYSWYSNKGNGFRIDHFFVSAQLKPRIKDCYYNHEVRERKDKVSDHSMMVLELG
jgi:exodeoxyribonuclease-3